MKEQQDLSTAERTAHMKAALYDALKWQHWLNGKADAAAIAGRYEPPTSQPWRRRFKCVFMLCSAPLCRFLLCSTVLRCSALRKAQSLRSMTPKVLSMVLCPRLGMWTAVCMQRLSLTCLQSAHVID